MEVKAVCDDLHKRFFLERVGNGMYKPKTVIRPFWCII